jgi:hypothetical protein
MVAIALDPSHADLHARFLELLPRIELHGRIYFRHVPCRHRKAEAIQEMIALGWLWFVRLARKGKDPSEFVRPFVSFLARAVSSGRKLTGIEKAKDVMNPFNQRRHGFTVESLPMSPRVNYEELYARPGGQELHDVFEERLRDNTRTPVPEQAAFRIDWPVWVKTRTDRDRRIIGDLMSGERTKDVSRKYGLSPARVSQLRQDFHDDWERFNSDKCREPCAA